jgi:hypothetical protein
MPAAGYSAVVDRDGVSPELSSDIEEVNRRRADIAVGWATVEAQNRRRRRVYGLAGAAWAGGLLLAVTTAMFLPVYLSEHGVIAEATLGWLATVSSLGTMAVGCGLYGWWYVASGRPGRTPGTGRGGPPATGDVAEALADADWEDRRLRLARNAMPRLDYLRASSHSAEWAMVGKVALATVPLFLGMGLFSMFATRTPHPYTWLVFGLWMFPVALTAAYVWLSRLPRRPRRGRRAIEQSLAQLAVYLGGGLVPSLAETVDWLNRYWAAPSSTNEYYAGRLHCGATGTAAGYPVMVDFEPDGLSDEYVTYPPRVAIYVAAVPAREPTAVPSARAGQLCAYIGDAGFTVDIEPDAGLVARATPPTVEALSREPAGLGHLGPLIGDLAALAAAEGVAPAPADLPAHQSPGGRGSGAR